MNLKEINEGFLRFEDEFGVYDFTINGVCVWKIIRFNLHNLICIRHKIHEPLNAPPQPVSFKLILAHLFNIIFKNPFYSTKHRIIFWGHPRRIKENDNSWWDLYCDPIIEKNNFDYVYIEPTINQMHFTPPRTRRIYYLDFINFAVKILLKFYTIRLSKKDIEFMSSIENELKVRFDLNSDIMNLMVKTARKHIVSRLLYTRLLKKIKPSFIILVVGYGNEALIDSGKKNKIPVIELQHGTIYPDHFGYALPKNSNVLSLFPDIFITYGDYWKNNIHMPLSDANVISIGNPYLESKIKQYDLTKKSKKVVFISQKSIGLQLSRVAVALNKRLNSELTIYYKLHPHEYIGWRMKYPWLETEGIVVLLDEIPLYNLLAEAQLLAGVYSTALYEGIAFNCAVVIMRLPGSENMRSLVDSGLALYVESGNELADVIEKNEPVSSRSSEYIFRSGWEKNLKETFRKLDV